MKDGFVQFIKARCHVTAGSRILLAVSGGMDSVALADLCHRSGFRTGIAHCNFSLRGKESDGDEEFVRNLSSTLNVPFYSRRFDTRKYAAGHRLSLQMAARELRYSWFEEVRKSEGYETVATAHHLGDQVETFFINLLRGTGIAGLHGIMARQGNLIRPLLFAKRSDIENYIRERNLSYRNDHSNDDPKYLRNRIRHQLLPLIADLQPEYLQTIGGTIEKLRETEMIMSGYINSLRESLIIREGNRSRVPLDLLKQHLFPGSLPWMILEPFGFNEHVIDDLIEHLDDHPGKQFFSPQFRMILDRKEIVIIPREEKEQEQDSDNLQRLIPAGEDKVLIGKECSLKVQIFERPGNFDIPADPAIASLDADKVTFPLTARRWKPGDSFFPLGLNRRKKISDLLTDLKLPRNEKAGVMVLASGKEIIWVIGHRISHRFRITNRTLRILQIRSGHGM